LGKDVKKWLATYLSPIALVFSLLFNYIQYSQNQTQIEENRQQRIQLDSVKYIENALTFRPRLELIGNPIIKNMQLSYDKEVFNPFFTPDSVINDTIASVKGEMTLTASFKLKNRGDAIAKIQVQSLTDTFSSEPILRIKLLDAIESGKIKIEYFNNYSKLNLGKDDSTVIDIDTDIGFVIDNEVNLHFIVFYENEFGHLYDTYIWVVFDNVPTLFRPKIGYDEKSKRIFGVLEEQYSPDRFKCKIVNTETKFYDMKTANRIKKFFVEAHDQTTEDKDTLKTKL